MKTTVYNQKGKEAGQVEISDAVFGAKWNADLVQQVAVSMQSNARTTVAHTKDRSEVRGGGKKPWKQKGTGRARHGSRRSPIWVGGGVAFGPRNDRNYAKKINKKMKAKALYAVLSRKQAEGQLMFMDALSFAEPKTQEAKAVITAVAGIKGYEKVGTKKKNATLVIIPENDKVVKRSFQNIGNVSVEEIKNLNVLDVLTYTHVVIVDPQVSNDFLSQKLSTPATAVSKS